MGQDEVEGSKGERGWRASCEGAMWKKEVTRTRRATRHANIGFSVRTFGPSARETFIRRFISAIHGWMATDGERDRVLPMKKPSTHREQLSPPRSFMGTDRPTDRPTNRPTNDVKTRANVLPIGYREKSRSSPKFFRSSCHCCIFIFSRSKNNISASSKYLSKL